jgi:glycosyltransferase involved in cell wall biosynthesis
MTSVALITEFFHPTTGGTQTAVAWIAEKLAIQGLDTIVIAPHYYRTLPSQPSKHYLTIWLRARSASLLSYLRLHWGIFRRLKNSDVLHLFHPAFGLGSLMAKLLWRKPLIVNLMGYDTYGFRDLPRPKRLVAQAVCQRCDILISPSADLARLARLNGVKRDIEIIYHGTELPQVDAYPVPKLEETLRLDSDTLVFVAVQRHYPIKSPEVFLDAWSRLGREECRLVLVGGGEMEAELRQRIKSLNLTNVILTGEVSPAEVSSYLAVADVFIHHSNYESFGIAIVEAMSQGLPIIATDVGAVSEIVTNELEGILVAPSDPRAMVRAVSRLADSPSLRKRMSRAALLKSQQFTWDGAVESYISHYRRLHPEIWPDDDQI